MEIVKAMNFLHFTLSKKLNFIIAMKHYFLLFFLLFGFTSSGQTTQLIDTTFIVTSELGEKITFQIKDFNRDGYVDTLSHYYSGGSGFGGRNAKIVNGKNREIFEANYSGCFCSLVHQWVPEKILLQSKNRLFRNILENSILPPIKNKPDASLQWIISAAYHHKELISNQYFKNIISPKVNWLKHPIRSPFSYRILMSKDSLDKIVPPQNFQKEKTNVQNQDGWLIYFGHNHFRTDKADWKLVGQSREYDIYKTQHGIIASKTQRGIITSTDNLGKWIFVTERHLTGSPSKLRWQSISKVELVNDFLVIQLSTDYGEDYKIFIVELESGVVGETHFKVPGGDVFEITKENRLIISFNGKVQKLELDLILKELLKFK